MATMTTNASRKSGFIETLSAYVAARVEAYRTYRVYRTTFEELNRLNNRELSDLGIHRSNLKSIAHEAAYGY